MSVRLFPDIVSVVFLGRWGTYPKRPIRGYKSRWNENPTVSIVSENTNSRSRLAQITAAISTHHLMERGSDARQSSTKRIGESLV